MTLIVKQISRTADGRVITRPTQIERTAVTIGRTADCEVHLADLAVLPRHALIERLDARRIRVKALGTLGFSLDGRNADDVQIDAGNGDELGFGSHRLTIGLDGEAVVIAVERVGALSESAQDKDEQRVFSLQGRLPGKRISAWGFFIAVLVAFLAFPIWSWATYQDAKVRPVGYHADRAWSSGPLSLAHQSLQNDCQACHKQPFVAVRDDACTACHTETHDHILGADAKAKLIAAKGEPDFGGRVLRFFSESFNKPPGRCVACHTEHEGAGPMQPTAQQFCADCHSDLKDRVPKTALGSASDFGMVHPQFQPNLIVGFEGRKPVFRRISFDQKPFEANGLKFTHAQHLSATNGVAQMARRLSADYGFGAKLECSDCHKADADGTRFKPVDMETNCQMCHSLAFDRIDGTVRTLRHGDVAQTIADLRALYRTTSPLRPINFGDAARRRPGLLQEGQVFDVFRAAVAARPAESGAAVLRAFGKGGICTECHVVDPPGVAGRNWTVRPVAQTPRYFTKGWFDHDAHKAATPAGSAGCIACHAAPQSNAASDLLIPDLAVCRTCHVGESGASKTHVAAPVNSTCALCHSYHADDGAPWLKRQRVARQKPGTNSAAQQGGQ